MMSSISCFTFRNLIVQSTASRFQPLVRCLTSYDEERFRSLLENFQGGSVDLKKNEENGIATLLVNNPPKKNAFTGVVHKWNIVFGVGNTYLGNYLGVKRCLVTFLTVPWVGMSYVIAAFPAHMQ